MPEDLRIFVEPIYELDVLLDFWALPYTFL